MVMLCFVLDLRNLSPTVFRAVKQSLLQLANLYSVSDSTCDKSSSQTLSDRIGLCFIAADRKSRDQLTVAYEPSEEFILRNFHHAVNALPTDAFSPKVDDNGVLSTSDMKFASFLNSKVLYKWGGHEKDIAKKVILISSCVAEELDSAKEDILMDAAEKCISIDFLLLDPKSSFLSNLSENISKFIKQVSDLENCSFHTYLPDPQILSGLVKRWLQEVRDDIDEPLQGRLIFKTNIFGTVNCISCTFSATCTPVIDGFIPCQACRCHGISLDDIRYNKSKQSCPVTGDGLKDYTLVETSLKVGVRTVLLLPSCEDYENLKHVSQPVDLNVVERTSLGSLNEAVLLGTPFLVSPSAFCESDDLDKSELNSQVFQGICAALHSLDQGLVCSSKCNIETKREALFHCYYILEPSEKGYMLLRRLAGSEEALPLPDVSQLTSSSATGEIKESVLASLLKMEARDYNPTLHERSFHKKLNVVVKQSTQPGLVTPLPKDTNIEPDVFPDDYSDQFSDRVTEEWEKLVVCEAPKISSPKFAPKRKSDPAVLSFQDSSQKINAKTSMVLERLEPPRQLKRKSPINKSTSTFNPEPGVKTKAPLIPFPQTHGSEKSTPPSQPMKPNFQRNKKKQDNKPVWL